MFLGFSTALPIAQETEPAMPRPEVGRSVISDMLPALPSL